MLILAREVVETKEATKEEAEAEILSIGMMMRNIEGLILLNCSSKHDKMKTKVK